MFKRLGVSASLFLLCIFALTSFSRAQQTLGAITGVASDTSGAVLSDVAITIVETQTGLSRNTKTSDTGSYLFPNLPIGDYALTFAHPGFETQKVPSILV